MAYFYILDGHVPKKVDFATFSQVSRHPVIASDAAKAQGRDVKVETLFFGRDESEAARPLPFHTYIFKADGSSETLKCATWAEAVAQHANALAKV